MLVFEVTSIEWFFDIFACERLSKVDFSTLRVGNYEESCDWLWPFLRFFDIFCLFLSFAFVMRVRRLCTSSGLWEFNLFIRSGCNFFISYYISFSYLFKISKIVGPSDIVSVTDGGLMLLSIIISDSGISTGTIAKAFGIISDSTHSGSILSSDVFNYYFLIF